MDRLCFATFVKALQPAMQKPNSNQAVVELLYDFVVEEAGESALSPDFAIRPKNVSRLLSRTDNVHEDVVALSQSPKVMKAMPAKFAKRVMLVDVLKDDLTENLRALIVGDKTVSQTKKDGLLALANKDRLADFLSETYLYALNRSNRPETQERNALAEVAVTKSDMVRLKEIYAKFQRPADLEVPPEPMGDEMAYIAALLAAYAEAEGLAGLSRDLLAAYTKYDKYRKDLRQRRKEYYAAETIRRGTREVFGEFDTDQFELLKGEAYDGIFDTHSQTYQDGYARLLAVMKQVSGLEFNRGHIGRIPNWIGVTEKKGVCHILVSEGTIKWAVRDE
jgi:hypothetical protein